MLIETRRYSRFIIATAGTALSLFLAADNSNALSVTKPSFELSPTQTSYTVVSPPVLKAYGSSEGKEARPPVKLDLEKIPTPALLPGLLVMGTAAVVRKWRSTFPQA